jgi:CRISPR-associated endoribonuclease Cas6
VQYTELTIAVYLKKDIYFEVAGDSIGELISSTLYMKDELRKIHEDNCYKYYCFGSLFPIEKDKFYKKGHVYTFKLRTLKHNLADGIRKNIKHVENSNFTVLAIEYLEKNNKYFSNIYSVTPVVVSMDKNKCWTIKDDFMEVQKRLIANLEKKYKIFYGEVIDISNEIFNRIELMNRVPMKIQYKNRKFLGNKFKIWFNESTESQKLAFIALSCGLGEKNSSCGAGFCMGGQNG